MSRMRALIGLLTACSGACGGTSPEPIAPSASHAAARSPEPEAPKAVGHDLTPVQLMAMWDGCQGALAKKHPELSGAYVGKACSCVVDRARALSLRGEDPTTTPSSEESERCRTHAHDTETASRLVPSPFAEGLHHPTEALAGGYLKCFEDAVGDRPPVPERMAHTFCFCLLEAVHTSPEPMESALSQAEASCEARAKASAR